MQRKFNIEPEFKESRQSFCFKTRPLPNFCRRNKQLNDGNRQVKPFSIFLFLLWECGFKVVSKPVRDELLLLICLNIIEMSKYFWKVLQNIVNLFQVKLQVTNISNMTPHGLMKNTVLIWKISCCKCHVWPILLWIVSSP